MELYKGEKDQIEKIMRAEVVKFYDQRNPPIYSIAEDRTNILNVINDRKDFYFECMTAGQLKDMMK